MARKNSRMVGVKFSGETGKNEYAKKTLTTGPKRIETKQRLISRNRGNEYETMNVFIERFHSDPILPRYRWLTLVSRTARFDAQNDGKNEYQTRDVFTVL